jgi:recombination protein RecA
MPPRTTRKTKIDKPETEQKLKKRTLQEERQLNIRDRLLSIGGVIEKAPEELYLPIDTDVMVSTGCTLLDLNISGGRVRGGGLPGGIVVELFGPESSGKTVIISELTASIQHKGGKAKIGDAEGRLDVDFARLFGADITSEMYWRPKSVQEARSELMKWQPENPDVINMYAIDGLASLSSQLDLTEDGDKRGQQRAKELHELCRKCCMEIAQRNKLVLFTNQERDTEYGVTTPGGRGVKYLASLRMRVKKIKSIEVSRTFNGKTIKQQIGVESAIKIMKSSIDKFPRECSIFIVDGMVDDIRGNLTYLKDAWSLSKYPSVDKEYSFIDPAIKYIEDNNLEQQLRDNVIDTWNEINELFKVDRKEKVRF